ncbi:hypothetical protein JL49_04120 [Pseudoalteromonas luteoviolacea]|uniref:Uncharacterized protein n=1 Tax=Pseudoalteromonas luteoviolacea NCIMB 1942 TaxID=1365253 RepID=A0A167HBY3_9GAMM|nr:hypothetical protein N482_22905 [Pseudoalteromonas luteoviolacea NCIMB 1942]KZX01714.1 hypothetical protein JL49_04120 [Pseudoalteromonas luteoviolacea]
MLLCQGQLNFERSDHPLQREGKCIVMVKVVTTLLALKAVYLPVSKSNRLQESWAHFLPKKDL